MTLKVLDKSELITMKCELEVVIAHLDKIAMQTFDVEWYHVSADCNVAIGRCLKTLQWIHGELKK